MASKKRNDPGAKEFWEKAKEASKEVDQWPAWKRLETTHRLEAKPEPAQEDGAPATDGEEKSSK